MFFLLGDRSTNRKISAGVATRKRPRARPTVSPSAPSKATPPDATFISEKHCASMLMITPLALRNMRSRRPDELPWHKFRKVIRYDRRDVEAYLAKHRVGQKGKG